MKTPSIFMMVYRAAAFFLILILMILLSQSCSLPTTEMDPALHYKMDMRIKNKNHSAIGMIVLPQKDLYTIELESKGRFNYFTFKTCSREIAIENAKRGLNRHKVKINYRPNIIERRGCPVELRAFDVKGRHSLGHIAIKDKYLVLPAFVVCGGTSKSWDGVSVCQEGEGLKQSITFDNNVFVSFKKNEHCKFKKKRGKTFEFEITKGLCVATFMEIKEPRRIHKLTTYGHEGNLVRE